ncbi:glycoside hydrolase family 5 protein [Paenibacillus spongiae]|uniref:Glycoside hydrolase family 5 protein n=1 Tax=Paenibacillus spongiae TaxID=2909671 RepID=A0ABY5SDF5_9BACL|nr:glycoside hydrolase family 5 protein [Paenibacillus spongiae]UVI31989.1 glycoside hydrolase family 5 protein [Paenibacillus spongiae]
MKIGLYASFGLLMVAVIGFYSWQMVNQWNESVVIEPMEVVAASGGLLKIGDEYRYVHGANLAWLDGQFDHDIGPNTLHPSWGVAYRSDNMSSYLSDMSGLNLNVVRIWLFENLEGLVFDENGYVAGVDPTFISNLDDIVRLAEEHDIYLYLTLSGSLVHTEKFNIVTDAPARKAYIDLAVRTIVSRYKGNDRIFAFDIMNEADSEVRGDTGNWSDKGTDWEVVRSFIKDNADAVHEEDAARLVTSTSGWHNWRNIAAGKFSGLGLDFYDFHDYRDDGELPDAASLGVDKPVLLGEYGQSTDAWDDEIQKNAAARFLANARSKGYAGALIWNYGHPGSKEIHTMLGPDGSHRAVAEVLRNFNWYEKQGM